jgi:hypothetical protein
MALMALLAIFVWEAVSDEPPAADRPHKVPVAVLDLSRVFKQHRLFHEDLVRLKNEIDVYEAEMRKNIAEVSKTKSASEADAEIKGIYVDVELKRKQFRQRESEVYALIFEQVERDVAHISEERDIGVVLVDDSKDKKLVKGDYQAIFRAVGRQTLYSRGVDITEDVILALNAAIP